MLTFFSKLLEFGFSKELATKDDDESIGVKEAIETITDR